MTQHPDFETIATDLLSIYDITTPPIPIENMLQHPRAGMWEQVDITQLSSSFLTLNDLYSPRMSLARMLARHVASSQWGKDQGLTMVLEDPDLLYAFGRMLIMPKQMVMELSTSARTPAAMSVHFEVPEEDARLRLSEVMS